jgi:hypothetical protein
MKRTRPAVERFMSKVRVERWGWTWCWIWTGSKDKKGYGSFNYGPGQGSGLAHRWSYEHFIGPVPDGMELDHYRCINPSCVRPSHLRPTISLDNSRNPRGRHNAVKTHCKYGHEFTPENTKFINTVKKGRRYTLRECRICRRRRRNHETRKYRARRMANN